LQKGFSSNFEAHNAQWAKKWEKCDVKIEGDDEAQLALRYSIFQLLMVAPVKGSANSIPARALSGQVYKGAIFWDTEMFMFPFFVYTYPEVAIELLKYRINTLDGARRKAASEGIGYRGAFYAWESQETGDDACTYFNIGDPHTGRDLRTHFRDKQIHISGDVAVAMWEYFKLTTDDSLLRNGGAEVILECARFYYSYAYYKKDKDRYELLDVIGPDEYHERVNNNIFTNKIASETFRVALDAVNYLKENFASDLDALLAKIEIANEIPLFQEAFEKLYLPQPDKETGVIEQFDAYYKLEDATVEDVKSRVIHPNEYLGAGQGVAVQTQVIKQADAIMMLNLFKEHYSHEVKKANWEFYEPRTEHGSSLSACAYALVAADIGKSEWAYKYFLKTAKLDLEAKYKVYVGTIFMGGSHPAANGGAWMATIFGFAGVKAYSNKVSINPKLYDKWKSLSFNLSYKGDNFAIKITPDETTVQSLGSNIASHKFVLGEKEFVCDPGRKIETKY
jgi:nigerose phosphorylase